MKMKMMMIRTMKSMKVIYIIFILNKHFLNISHNYVESDHKFCTNIILNYSKKSKSTIYEMQNKSRNEICRLSRKHDFNNCKQ